VIAAAAPAVAIAALLLVATAPTPTVDRVDEQAAWSRLVRQVRLGPRPAGSPASRKLAAQLKAELPGGRFQAVPGGLRNVVGVVPGRDPSRTVVVGGHYDTKDLPGFVGANDGAGGTALVVELARTVKPRELRPTVVFILFDGEESPDDNADFYSTGMRGSRVAARRYRNAEAMINIDFVADRDLSLARDGNSSPAVWRKLRSAARRVGTAAIFPPATQPPVMDDHLPFHELGVPAIDLIDFDYPCWHRTCDNLSRVSKRSLDAVGETVYELLRSF
jgi:Zn-dependent M28 family amino/carboxypeptidase